MIQVNHISFKYAGSKHLVFDDFSLTLEENRIYGLLGKNGTGKSTLLYLISGLLRPSCGSVCCDGIATKKREPETLRDIFFVTEEFEMPAIRLSEYVKLYKPFYPNFSDEVLQECLADFELPADVHLNELSMGQRKKAYIAFAMATNTKYLFMDEPTNGLDIPSKSQFRKVIARHMTEERTVVVSTHQVHDVEQMLDHILMLDKHSVLLNASMQEIQDQYTFEYRSPQQMDDTVLYAEPTLQGNAVIRRRQEGDAETQVNLELLFNYKTTSKTGSVL
jgi:ABC-2 type transport system ATP-binding protein